MVIVLIKARYLPCFYLCYIYSRLNILSFVSMRLSKSTNLLIASYLTQTISFKNAVTLRSYRTKVHGLQKYFVLEVISILLTFILVTVLDSKVPHYFHGPFQYLLDLLDSFILKLLLDFCLGLSTFPNFHLLKPLLGNLHLNKTCKNQKKYYAQAYTIMKEKKKT